jgi:23S rRNA (adenine2030-N6)-methyltransferase
MKHVLLVWLLRALARKPAPFAVLDTHAGRGDYDLAGGEAARGAEWPDGIGRVAAARDGPLADYAALVHAAGYPARYPGSPRLARALLRPQDRLILCELHPEEHAALRRGFAADPQVAVHRRDGWEALRALTPFAERRGLVLIDPPYEAAGEFERLAEAFPLLHRRAATLAVAAWYPIKHRAPSRALHAALAGGGVPDLVAAELLLREPTDPRRLNGCGLILANPPYGLEAEAPALLAALLARLGDGEPGAATRLLRLADE